MMLIFKKDEAYEDNENNDAIDVGENLLVDRRTTPNYAKPFQCRPCNAAPCSPILSMQPYQSIPSSAAQCSLTSPVSSV